LTETKRKRNRNPWISEKEKAIEKKEEEFSLRTSSLHI
jgi:hypothetical protein